MYLFETKDRAIKLRKKGYSIKEIAKILKIAQSTSSLWLQNITLNNKALTRLKERKILGQYNALLTRKKKKIKMKESFEREAFLTVSKVKFTTELNKLLCSIFFWTEGGKFTDSYLYFINSDPKMVRVFIKLLRLSFTLDEKKLRAMVHVHEYHDEEIVRSYWSSITDIPISQFSKSYLKVNTKKRIRDNYQGCLRIRYYDHKVALELRSIYNVLAQNI